MNNEELIRKLIKGSNVIGSRFFNMLLILALVAVIEPVPVSTASLQIDLPAKIALVALLVPIMLRGMVVSRWVGAFLLACYGAFLGWQLFSAFTSSGG